MGWWEGKFKESLIIHGESWLELVVCGFIQGLVGNISWGGWPADWLFEWIFVVLLGGHPASGAKCKSGQHEKGSGATF